MVVYLHCCNAAMRHNAQMAILPLQRLFSTNRAQTHCRVMRMVILTTGIPSNLFPRYNYYCIFCLVFAMILILHNSLCLFCIISLLLFLYTKNIHWSGLVYLIWSGFTKEYIFGSLCVQMQHCNVVQSLTINPQTKVGGKHIIHLHTSLWSMALTQQQAK